MARTVRIALAYVNKQSTHTMMNKSLSIEHNIRTLRYICNATGIDDMLRDRGEVLSIE